MKMMMMCNFLFFFHLILFHIIIVGIGIMEIIIQYKIHHSHDEFVFVFDSFCLSVVGIKNEIDAFFNSTD